MCAHIYLLTHICLGPSGLPETLLTSKGFLCWGEAFFHSSCSRPATSPNVVPGISAAKGEVEDQLNQICGSCLCLLIRR